MSPELEALIQLSDNITIAGVLLFWVWTLRGDIRSEKDRVDGLIERIIQLKKDSDMKDTQPIPDMRNEMIDDRRE
jgi:hypothetical protein